MILWLIPCLSWFGAAQAALTDGIAAIVNDEVIALSEVYELGGDFIAQRCPDADRVCEHKAELEILDTLVQQVLIRQELSDLGLSITGVDVDRAIEQIRKDHNIADITAFRVEIEASGLRWDTYRDQLTDQLRQMSFSESILRPRVTLGEDELLDLYNRSVRGVEGPKRRVIEGLSIAIEDRSEEAAIALAQEVIRKVETKEQTWQEVIALHHSGFIAADDGSMGAFAKGELSTTLDDAVFGADVGAFTVPVNLGTVVMVLRVIDEQSEAIKSFEESQAALSDSLYTTKIEREMARWYEIAKRKSSVQFKLKTE